MKIINSPNYDQRPNNTIIDTIIIHHTKMPDYISALKRLCDPEAKVSAHYLINKQGEIFLLVADDLRAFHAGVSYWRGREKVNDFSIGIELDNNGEEEFSSELMNSLIELCHKLINSYPIDKFNVIGHSDVAPGRKDDPGALFDWVLLAQNNIGVMPEKSGAKEIPDIKIIQTSLAKYGYKIEITGQKDQQTLNVMKAFNEHFNQKCGEDWNLNSQGMLEELIKLL